MATLKIQIIDYGMGNIHSVVNAFDHLGLETEITSDPVSIKKSECLVLPGVGSFHRAMITLEERGLADSIREAVLNRKVKILGICLGMQLLCEAGSEDTETKGLGFIPGRVDRFKDSELTGNKVPHIGFNTVDGSNCQNLFKGLKPSSDFYFVHSYRLLPENLGGNIACCTYGTEFVAAYQKDNIFATQFHPEKSQNNGLRILKNFIEASC